MRPSRYVLTTVHGTFARGAEWAQPNSAFCMNLEKALGEPVDVHAFDWSGENSHQARSIATKDLTERLREQLKIDTSRDAFHLIVAHSHGGNIAIRAQQDLLQHEQILAIVTFGTPFIGCEPRVVKDSIKTVSLSSAGLLSAGAVVAIWAAWLGSVIGIISTLPNDPAKFGPLSVITVIAWLVVFLGGGAISGTALKMLPQAARWLAKRIYRTTLRFVTSSQRNTAKRLSFAQRPQSIPLFCAIVTDDEAGRWLELIRAWSNILPSISLPLAKMSFLAIRIAIISIMTFLCLLPLVPRSWINNLEIATGSMLALALGLSVLLVFLQLPTILVQLGSRSHRFGFGGESMLDNWFSDIFVSQTPLGMRCEAFTTWSRKAGLHHSSFFTNSRLVETIACWIRERSELVRETVATHPSKPEPPIA